MDAEAVMQYAIGLQKAAMVKRQAVKPENQKARDRAVRELEEWLAQNIKLRDLTTFVPADFEVYFMNYWRDAHGKNGKLPAPVMVAALIAHLTVELDGLGREGEWRPAQNEGEAGAAGSGPEHGTSGENAGNDLQAVPCGARAY